MINIENDSKGNSHDFIHEADIIKYNVVLTLFTADFKTVEFIRTDKVF